MNNHDNEQQYFTGIVKSIKDKGELNSQEQKGIIEFSEELSDGGERDEIIRQQIKDTDY